MDERRMHLVYEVVLRADRGESMRGIARALRISRPTVRSILMQEKQRRDQGETAVEAVLPRRRAPRGCKLDPFEKRITAWLEQYPNLTAIRLMEKLREIGFDGGYTIVRLHLKQLRSRSTPKEAVEIVETAPGQQGQFDWSPYALTSELTVQLWSFTLSWSRARTLADSTDTRQPTIFRCLRGSFEKLGGVPNETVTDSMPGVVDRWECGKPILNVRFVDFAAFYRFSVNIAPRGDGPYKGKVERVFRYVQENLMNGRTFHSLDQFHEVLTWWEQHRAMQRPHPLTRRPLHEMLQEERAYLKPLPQKPYDTREVVIRLVDTTGHIVHETNLYRIPDEHIGQLVYVCLDVDRLEVFDSGVHLIAQHERFPDGARQRSPSTSHKRRYDVTLLIDRMSAWGEAAADFAARVKATKRYPGPELAYIINLQTTWSADDILSALEHAMKYEAYEPRAVERILQARFTPRTLGEQVAQSTRAQVRETMREHPVLVRPLSGYTALREGDRRPGTDLPQKQEKQDHGQDTEGQGTAETDPSPGQADESTPRTTDPGGHSDPTDTILA